MNCIDRRKFIKIGAGAIVLGSSGVLAACANNNSTNYGNAGQGARELETPVLEDTSENASEIDEVEVNSSIAEFNVTDPDGFQYNYKVEIEKPTADVDTTVGKPGEVGVDTCLSGALTVTNITPGKKAPKRSFGAIPVWRKEAENERVAVEIFSTPCSKKVAQPDIKVSYPGFAKHQVTCFALDNTFGTGVFEVGEEKAFPFSLSDTRNIPEDELDEFIDWFTNPIGWVISAHYIGLLTPEDSSEDTLFEGWITGDAWEPLDTSKNNIGWYFHKFLYTAE